MTSLDRVSWPVTTERLSIRPSVESDAVAFHAYRRLPEVAEWLPRLSEDLDAVEERFRDADFRARTLVIERQGQVIGDLYLSVADAWAQAEVQDQAPQQTEIGWALGPDHQGQGLAFEAVQALVALCFTELALHRVYATCFTDNVGSWRLMEKLGMRRESHAVKDSLHRERGWLDGYTYALLAEEWTAALEVAEAANRPTP
jgi:RimJ/RimL family protein N-acetyltransferase